ncbi:MAG: peptide chain release factor N(5)-glutamine methyltransferase [Agarilytica sp.]
MAQWIKTAQKEFEAVSDSARLDAEVLLAQVLKKDRSYLYTWPEKEIPSEELKVLDTLRCRRNDGEPIAYIVGEREFWSLPLYVDISTLIPRPETELLIETCLEVFSHKQPLKILDLGTGTGAIALALAKEFSNADVCAVDKEASAVELAKSNAARHSISNVNISSSDWFSEVKEKYDLIVSNPPYIDAEDPHLHQGDVRFEPHSALVAAGNGLADIHRIAEGAREYLLPGGVLMFEHGFQQAESVNKILKSAGFVDVKCKQDLQDRDRISFGTMV